MVANNDRVSVAEANRRIGRRRGLVRELVEQGKLTAWRVGGGSKIARLEVSMAELRRVLNGDVYIPKGLTRDIVRKKRRQAMGNLHPTALDL
jgi:excisionase family DNA binding protein